MCLFKVAASAFWHVRLKKTARSIHNLVAGGRHWIDGWKPIQKTIKEHDPYRKIEITKVGYCHRRDFDPIEHSEKYMLCILGLKSKDGKTDHAVAICKKYLFDSNFSNALPLNMAALNYCYSSNASIGEFECMWKGIALKDLTKGHRK